MSQQELTVKKRVGTGKELTGRLRKSGELPVVLYGHKQTPVNYTVNAREISDLVQHHGMHSLLVLQGDGGGETAIIKAVQRHPVRGTLTTLDFLRVSANEPVTVTVHLVLDGEPEGVKTGDGVLVQSLHEVSIKSLPGNVPEAIHVDVSGLETNGAALTLADVTLPSGVELITDASEAVAVVNLPQAEVEEPVAPEGEEATAEAAADVPAENGAEGDPQTEDKQ